MESGLDANGNGVLDEEEIAAENTKYVCHGVQGIQGEQGVSGLNVLVQTAQFAPGAEGENCQDAGGIKVESGLDANGNGVLDEDEIIAANTQYVCNGAQGIQGETGETGAAGHSMLVNITEFAAGFEGENCAAAGGIKVESGLDSNGNGVLDEDEIIAANTQYVCSGAQGIQGETGETGAAGHSMLVNTVEFAPGEAEDGSCRETGGIKIESGLDANGNGVLDADEIIAANTKYLCNGAQGIQGDPGTDGVSASIQTAPEPVGGNCANGGVKVEVLLNGVVQPGQTTYVCHGSQGIQGETGETGASGHDMLVQTAQFAAGAEGDNCRETGGIKIESGLDANGNGVLDSDERASGSTQYVCHGSQGIQGEQGNAGTSASIQTTPEPAGGNCANGGVKEEVLLNGDVQPGQTEYVCNGANASFQLTDELPGENCDNGGVKIELLIGGVIQEDQTSYVCNGRQECSGSDVYLDGNGICKPFTDVTIPAGSFVLSHKTAAHNAGDTVTLTSFTLSRVPVTVAQYTKCIDAGVCTHFTPVSTSSYCNYGRTEAWNNHPMNCIPWTGAVEYCDWIGGRLPTEEEWEYAATHNGTEHLYTAYPWGDEEPEHCVTANYYDGSKYCNGTVEVSATGYMQTTAVGTFSPKGDSPLGLVDLGGNVWEWTSSRSGNDRYVVKGGAYNSQDGLNVTTSINANKNDWHSYYGFRCVFDVGD